MHPEISLDDAVLARNLQAWRAFAGVPVRPVIKCNAYNWGYGRVVAALDAFCDTYCVSDFEELLEARRYTSHAIVVLNAIPHEHLTRALDMGAIPTIEEKAGLDAVVQWSRISGRRPRIRVGVVPAVGWSGIDLAAIEKLAPDLAASRLDIEVWTHITDPPATMRQASRLSQAVHTLRGVGARVVATEVASTYSLASFGAMGDSVRVGIGLFGSTGGLPVPGVHCALRVSAPVLRVQWLQAGTKVGYGDAVLTEDGHVVIARCGYGDGLPKGLANASDILSIGMQYVTMRPRSEPFGEAHVVLLDGRSDLDAFAVAAGQSPHEIVTGFGHTTTGELATS